MNGQPYDLDTFFQTSKNDMEKKIETTISDNNIVSILKGGKYLHSLLGIISYKTCTSGKETSDKYQRALELAVLIEIACTASLVHEFIIEIDKERRGKRSFYVQEVINSAILYGHKLLISGINIALTHGDEITRLVVETWDDILTGGLMDIDFNKNEFNSMSEEVLVKSEYFSEYNKIINMKTASLFSFACITASIEADMPNDTSKILANYGRETGLAYQLAIDLVDLKKGGKIDSMMASLVNKLGGKTHTVTLKARAVRKKFTKYIKHSSEIEQVFIDEVKKHVSEAEKLSKSDLIPSSNYKTLLTEAPSYIVNKMLKEINISI